MSGKQHTTGTSNTQSEQTIAGFGRQIIDACPSSMILVDAQADDMPIVYVNAAFEALTGYASEEAIGRNCRFLQGDDPASPDLDVLRQALESKQTCTVTLRNYRKDGTLFWNELRISTIFGADGQATHFVGMQNDVTERKRATEALRDSEALYTQMMNHLPDVVVLYDADLRFLFVNIEGQRRSGYAQSHFFGKTDEDVFPPEITQDYMPLLRKAQATGEVQTAEVDFELPSGSYTSIVTYVPITNEQGEVKNVLGLTREITERRLAEIARQKSEELYRLLTEHSHDMIALHEPDGTFIYVSPSFERVLGFTSDELLDMATTSDMVHPDDAARCARTYQRLLEQQETIEIDYRLQRKDGNYIWANSVLKPILDEHGEIKHLLAVSRDITDRKQIEEALRKSEIHLRRVADNFPDGAIFMFDHDLRYILARGLGLLPSGHTSEELEGKTIYEALPQSTIETLQEQYLRTLSGDRLNEEYSYHGRHYLTRSVPIDQNGEIIAGLLISQDITERKQMEEALHESEKQYRNLFENTMHEVHLWKLVRDEQGTIKTWQLVEANPAALKAWGKNRPDIIGKTTDEIFSYNATEQFMPIVKKIFSDGTPYTWETYFPPTGAFLYMTSVPFGEYFMTTGTDITERKQMEEDLARSMTDLKLAQRIASIGNWTFDPEVGVPVWSDEVYKIYERDPQLGPPSLEDYRNIYAEPYFDRFWTAIQAAISEGKPYDIKLNLNLPGGNQKWIHAICEPEHEKGPAGHLLRGTIQDVSETYHAQEALRESEERFRQLAENIEVTFWLIDIETREFLYVSPAYDSIWQRSRQELMEKGLEAFIPTLHPEDRDWSMQYVSDWLTKSIQADSISRKEATYRIEHRIVRPSGEIRSVETKYFLVRNQSGDFYRIAIITQDITERKQMENALRESEAYLQSVLDSQSTFVLRTDMDGRYTYVNDVMYEGFRWLYPGGKAEMIGTDSMLTIMPEDHEKTSEVVMNCIANPGQPFQVELCKPSIDGDVFWVLWDFVALTNGEGNVTEIQCIGIDVTERRETQQHKFELALERERHNLLTSFLQDAAHEFRTPLATINSSAHLMSRYEDPEKRADKAERVQDQVHRITRLVDMLLLMTKLESGDALAMVPVDLQAMMREVVQDMRAKCGKNHQIQWNVPPGLPLITGNAALLAEAFRHVIENACHFTPQDGTITLGAQTDDQHVAITVQDAGAGIASEDLPHIFETFWRRDTAHSTPGFGLGLPIAQRIIERHGGEITVNSELGEGSTFVLSLPHAVPERGLG